jgi:hypothetical protein
MGTATWLAAFLGLGLAAVSQSVGAQAGPTLTPALRFDVASVRAIDNTARSPMRWQPPGHFTSDVPLPSDTLTRARSDGRLGPNLRPSDVNCEALIAENRRRNLAGERLPDGPAPGERPRCGAVGGGASFTGGAAPLAGFVGMLSGALQRPVIDGLEMPTGN